MAAEKLYVASRNRYSSIGAWLVWWFLIAGRLASYIAREFGFWFDGFDFVTITVIPMVAVVVLRGAVAQGLRYAGSLVIFLMWSLGLLMAIAVFGQLGPIWEGLDPESVRSALVRPTGVVFGLILGLALGAREDLLRVVTGRTSNVLVLMGLGLIVARSLVEHSLSRVGGGNVFDVADGLSYLAVGWLAPMVARKRYGFAAVGTLLVVGLLMGVGLRSSVVSMMLSGTLVLALALLQRNGSTRGGHLTKRELRSLLVFGAVAAVFAYVLSSQPQEWRSALLTKLHPLWTLDWVADESVLNRLDQLQYGLGVAFSGAGQFMFGRFGYEYFELGNPGAYVHSILGILPEFGVLALVLTMLLMVLALRTVLRDFARTPARATIAWLLLYWLISAATARAYFTVHVWFAIGLSLASSAVHGRRAANCELSRQSKAIAGYQGLEIGSPE